MLSLLLLAALLQAPPADLDALKARLAAEKDQAPALRLPAVAALGALKTEEAASVLADLLDQDKDLSVRAAALKALGACGTPRALQVLVLTARDSQKPVTLRSSAVEALTKPPTPEGLGLCKTLLRDASDVRLYAWSGLRQYPLSKETEPLWRGGLTNDDTLIRAMAMSALAPLKEVVLQDNARKILLDDGAEPLLRYASVNVLREFGGAAVARVLLAAAALQPDLTLRRLLAEALGALTEDKAALEIYAALKHPDPVVRTVAARSLGRLRHAQAGDRLSSPLKDAVLEVRGAALEAVAERRDKNSEAILLREAQGTNEDAAALAISLLPAYAGDPVRQALVKLAGNAKAGVAVPALDALGELGGVESLPVFEKALRAKDWAVRVSAVRGLRKLRTKEAVDLLVDRMASEEGRLLADIAETLRFLTAKPFGSAAGQWKEWWTNAREAFTFPGPDAVAAAPQAGMTTYYGMPVVSTRLVFCVDISGSMQSESEGGITRLEQAKKELLRSLGQLGKDAQVNLVFFDDKIEPWHRQLVGIRQNLRQAQELIQRLQPRGQTNIFDALEVAFAHKEADTIYLLSDGEPSNGRITDSDDILREIRRMNRLRKVALHTVSFGGSSFLKALAEQNGGHYVEVR